MKNDPHNESDDGKSSLVTCGLRRVIGRIHGAIDAATGRSDRRRDDRPVYTLHAIVAATIASWSLD